MEKLKGENVGPELLDPAGVSKLVVVGLLPEKKGALKKGKKEKPRGQRGKRRGRIHLLTRREK